MLIKSILTAFELVRQVTGRYVAQTRPPDVEYFRVDHIQVIVCCCLISRHAT